MKWCLVGMVVFLVYATAPPVAAATPAQWTAEFDQQVHGDFVTVGNTVTVCPPSPSAARCRAVEGGVPAGPAGENDENWMRWADVDGRPETYDSSSARVPLPAGALVRHAVLTWAGDLGDGTGRCSRGVRPPGSPLTQSVTMVAAGVTTVLRPGLFEVRGDPWRPGLDRWYSAHADVTDALRGLRGPADVMVGDIWTPQGRACFGGWSLVVVWEKPQAPPRQVTVYTGHQRVHWGRPGCVRLREAGPVMLGVTAFEGDLGLAGDAILVGGRAQTPRPPASALNAFVSDAEGALKPKHVSNMAVDAKRLRLDPGPDPAEEIDLVTRRDDYLVATLAVSGADEVVAQAPAPAPVTPSPSVPPLPAAPLPAAPRPPIPVPAGPPVPAPPPPTPEPAPRVRPTVPAARPAPHVVVAERRDHSGPLAAPARTAAVIATLGVFAMTITVGAISGVARLRR
jgi:hypothetical protein